MPYPTASRNSKVQTTVMISPVGKIPRVVPGKTNSEASLAAASPASGLAAAAPRSFWPSKTPATKNQMEEESRGAVMFWLSLLDEDWEAALMDMLGMTRAMRSLLFGQECVRNRQLCRTSREIDAERYV